MMIENDDGTTRQNSTMILKIVTAIHNEIDSKFSDADDATKTAACTAAAGVYAQSLMRDHLVASMIKTLGMGP